jgi:hypothetical protein
LAFVAALAALMAVSASRVAMAEPLCDDDATACGKREFDRGISAYREHRFGTAIQHFQRAQEFTPHPAILFNLALAEMENGNVSAAAAHFGAVIDDTRSDEKLRTKAKEELALASSKSAVVTLDAPSGVLAALEVDGQLVGDYATGVRVDPGLHWIKLTADGRVTLDHSVHLDPGEHLNLAVEVRRERSRVFSSAPARVSPGVVYVTAGLCVVLTGASVWSGLDTLNARDAYVRDLPTMTQKQAQTRLDEGHVKELRTNLLIGGAALSAAATLAIGWFLVDWSDHERRVGVRLGPSSVAVDGVF